MEGEKNVLKNMETFLIALIGIIIMILLVNAEIDIFSSII